MRSRIAALAAIPAIVLVVALSVAGCSSHPTLAYSKLAHLDQSMSLASVTLPPAVSGVDSDIVKTSLRLLAVHDDVEYWVGATRDDRICFIARGVTTEAKCIDADQFGRYGMTLQLDAPVQRVWLHTEYMTVSPGWTVVSQNIAIRD
ncbi:hypothetical protein [Herbiconiux daphne]|uniref:Lipoprotein n=1 Tax=Herbiconiux daphne TaxID=2970914 RepID=A0ABT2H285_9MICO|nr:hypothetical protein [Herbiconiux daphne]MCS5734068.1 hypothetical protein [Herbiconiux daphne]